MKSKQLNGSSDNIYFNNDLKKKGFENFNFKILKKKWIKSRRVKQGIILLIKFHIKFHPAFFTLPLLNTMKKKLDSVYVNFTMHEFFID